MKKNAKFLRASSKDNPLQAHIEPESEEQKDIDKKTSLVYMCDVFKKLKEQASGVEMELKMIKKRSGKDENEDYRKK